eukprot:356690-Chlamydomonas_euryale.AAC.21
MVNKNIPAYAQRATYQALALSEARSFELLLDTYAGPFRTSHFNTSAEVMLEWTSRGYDGDATVEWLQASRDMLGE